MVPLLSPRSSLPPFCYGSNFSPLLSHRWQINTPSSQEKPSPNFCSIVLIAKGRILWSPMVVEDLLNQTTTNRWALGLLKSILKEQSVLCRLTYNFSQNNKDNKEANGFDAESDTATAESGQSPPLTMSPLLSSSHHSNGNGGISNVVGSIGGGNVTSSTGIGRSAANAANAAAAAATAKMINPSAALQLSQTLAAMHSLRWVQCSQL